MPPDCAEAVPSAMAERPTVARITVRAFVRKETEDIGTSWVRSSSLAGKAEQSGMDELSTVLRSREPFETNAATSHQVTPGPMLKSLASDSRVRAVGPGRRYD